MHPFTITKEFQASLVPEVGGAIRISIFLLGKLESISLHFLYGFSTNFPFTSTLAANALQSCSFVKFASGAFVECENVITSFPTTTSIISLTPFFSQSAFSFGLIALEE